MGFIGGTILIVVIWAFAQAGIKGLNKADGTTTPTRPATIVAVVLFVLLLAVCSITTVGTGKIAVMTRFGRVTGQELGEGLHFKLPTDKANKYDVKVQKEQAEAAAASKDLQDINSTLVLNYSLEAGKVDDIHRTLGGNYREKIIDPALQEVFKASTARFDATQIITDRADVKAHAADLLRDRLDPFGIRVVDLNITNFSFSKEFSAAIEAKQVAQQDAERATFKLKAAEIDAKAQKVQAATLSPLYLQKLLLDKWNGQMPQVLGSDAGLLLDVLRGQQ